jgi:drug/metabolite transporter (DMT)-like permease
MMQKTAELVAAERKGLGLGVVGVVIFGLTLPMTRLAVLEIDPLFVTLARALIAAAIAAIALVAARAKLPERRDWLRLAGFSLCVVLGFPLLMAMAMRTVPSSHGGVVLGVLPLLTAMASVVVAGERPSIAFWLCGVAGSATVVAYALIAGAGSSALQSGDVLLAFSAVSAAAGYALGGELSRRIGGWEVISWALVLAAPLMVLLMLVLTPPINLGASAKAWAALGYVAVFSQFAGFFAWNKGLALGGIAKVGQTQLLQTFVTLAGAAVILGEQVGILEIGFGVLVVAIVLIGWRLRVERTP